MKAAFLRMRIILWRGGWRGIRAFITTVFVGSVSVQWTSLSTFERCVIIGGGIVSAGDAIDAFLDRTFSRQPKPDDKIEPMP